MTAGIATAASPDPAPVPEVEDESGYPRPPVAWIATAILMLLFGLAYLDRQIIALMVEPIRAEFGVGDFSISLLQGFAFALLYAICGLPLGMAVDRFPRRYVILGGVLVWSLAAMSCGLAQTFNQLFLARVVVGAGEAALAPAAYSLLSDLFPKRKLTFALAVYMVGALIGSEISLALGGYLLHAAEGGAVLPILGPVPAWRFAFIMTGLPGIALAFLALLLHEPVRNRATHAADTGWRAVFAFLSTRKLFFAVQVFGFAVVIGLAYARGAWNPTYLMREFGWTVAEASYTLATYGFVTGLFGLLLGGRIVDWFFARGVTDAHYRYYVVGGIILTIGGVVAYTAPNTALFFAALALPSFPLNMGAIGAAAIQLITPQHMRGRVSAMYLMVTSLVGMSMGPAFVGFLTEHVFQDVNSIGTALALAFGIFGPVVTLLFWIGCKPLRTAIAAANGPGR